VDNSDFCDRSLLQTLLLYCLYSGSVVLLVQLAIRSVILLVQSHLEALYCLYRIFVFLGQPWEMSTLFFSFDLRHGAVHVQRHPLDLAF